MKDGIKIKVLIVDDEESILYCLKVMAQKNNINNVYDFYFSNNYDDALNLLENNISLLITDVSLGYKSGVKLAEKVLEKYPTAKVIFIHGGSSLRYNNIKFDFNEISKPFTLNIMWNSIVSNKCGLQSME